MRRDRGSRLAQITMRDLAAERTLQLGLAHLGATLESSPSRLFVQLVVGRAVVVRRRGPPARGADRARKPRLVRELPWSLGTTSTILLCGGGPPVRMAAGRRRRNATTLTRLAQPRQTAGQNASGSRGRSCQAGRAWRDDDAAPTAGSLPRHARLHDDTGADRCGGAHRRSPAIRRPATRRDAAALGPAARTRRRARLVGTAEGRPVDAEGQPPRGAHRGSPARVPRLRGAHTRRAAMAPATCSSGTAAPTRSRSGRTANSSSCSTAAKVERQVRPVRDPGAGLDDPSHGSTRDADRVAVPIGSATDAGHARRARRGRRSPRTRTTGWSSCSGAVSGSSSCANRVTSGCSRPTVARSPPRCPTFAAWAGRRARSKPCSTV